MHTMLFENQEVILIIPTGYKALIEFECLGVRPRHAAWMSFCSKVPRPIGYSDKNRILLHPPYGIIKLFYN